MQRQAFNARSPRLWLALAARAEILGALALRQRQWDLVRDIGLWRPPQVGVSYVASWIRASMLEARVRVRLVRRIPPRSSISTPRASNSAPLEADARAG